MGESKLYCTDDASPKRAGKGGNLIFSPIESFLRKLGTGSLSPATSYEEMKKQYNQSVQLSLYKASAN